MSYLCKKLSAGRACKSEGGFTLTEFAMVVLVSGLLLIAALEIYSVYLAEKRFNEVYEKQNTLSSSFSMFYSARGRYPCPADPSLPVTDANAGIENCNPLNGGVPLAVGECSGPGSTGICLVSGARGILSQTADENPVLAGAIPYKTLKTGMERELCFSKTSGAAISCYITPGVWDPDAFDPTDATMQAVNMAEILDPWGFQMTYLVTRTQTDDTTFEPSSGTISMDTEAGVSLVQPEDSVHFAIIAHGENHAGAYNQQGQRPFPCGIATGIDSRNCNLDSDLVSGLRSMAAGSVDYFDDVILHRAYTMSELWKFSGPTQNYIHNTNQGNVGIGTASPSEKLEVAGNVRALTTKSEKLCDAAGTNCWEPYKLGGSGMTCPDTAPAGFFNAMVGIRNGDVYCVQVALPTGFAGQSCTNPGEYMVGFNSLGEVICEAP